MAKAEIKQKLTTSPYNFVPLNQKVFFRRDLNKEIPNLNDISLNSGYFNVKMTAKTPVMVSGNDGKFTKDTKGYECIFGSTIKGMVRANMQILGFDKIMSDVKDYKIYFRDMTSSSSSVDSVLKDYYTSVLGVKTIRNGNRSVSKAENVKAGYIVNEQGEYKIYPTIDEVIRISPNHKGLAGFENTFYQIKDVWYDGTGNFTFQQDENRKKGVMLFTGKSVSKPNARYIFPEVDYYGNPETLSEEDVLNYKIDYKLRARVNKDGNNLWELPKENEKKPVFYVRNERNLNFGMTQFIRIAHKHKITDGIPEKHKLHDETFVEGILGYTKDDECLASRVNFGDFKASNVKYHDEFKAILGEPHASFYKAYVMKGKHYSDDVFRIRGYKKYWLKEFKMPRVEIKNEKVAETIKPLDVGTTFEGKIHFKNLHDEELGLLLWAITLNEDCFQTIGKGKSLGMGRMSVDITDFQLTNNEYNFESFIKPYKGTEDVQKYIKLYKNFGKSLIKKFDSKDGSIDDFMYVQSKIVTNLADIQDMGLDSANCTENLKTISELREEWEDKKVEIDPNSPWAKLAGLKFD